MTYKMTDPRVIYKFGKTKSYDVVDRFKDHELLKYYDIKPVFSQFLTEQEADRWETEYLQKYPKWDYDFDLSFNPKVDGITEMRCIDEAVVNKIRTDLYNKKSKLETGKRGRECNTKFYFVKFVKKDT